MPNQEPRLPDVFRALADPTRLAVVERLSQGRLSATDLAIRFDMSLPAFTEHLKVLERCGLVQSEKTGRIRTYELQTRHLATAQNWLDRQRQLWTKRLDQMDAFLLQTEGKTK